jgi:hypothetical protein
MGIIGAMGKAAVKEVRKSVNRKKKAILRKASIKPSMKKSSPTTKRKVRKLPASSVTRKKG